MFVGHLAVALGAKRIEPRVPLGAAVAAAFGLDLLWPLLLLAGFEVVRVNPNDTAFTHLAFDSYPWSHSLVMVLLWSALAAFVAWRLLGHRRAAAVVGTLVLSHWILDLATHRPDLPVWPSGPMYGLGLWNSVPATLLVEGGLIGLGLFVYLRATKADDRVGSIGLYGMIALCTLMWVSQPWAPPPPNAQAVAWGGLALWLLPPWSRWVEGHRSVKGSA